MNSRSNLPFAFLLLLAAVILIPSSMFHVIAVPTCGLMKNQARDVLGSNGTSNRTTTPSAGNTTPKNVVATGWYAGWLANQFPPTQISWSQYTALTFAFATTTSDSNITLDSTSLKYLPLFVQEAHKHGVKALISIGGWTGSRYFSTALAGNQTKFGEAVVNLVNSQSLDGVDIDWEYPAHGGLSCNTRSTSDSTNFLSFLKTLKHHPKGPKVITAAVGLQPFAAGSDGTPMTNVSEFADYLDHIAIMDYDVWGSFSPTVGPNAPLDDSCSRIQAGSASSAVKAWTSAHFPAELSWGSQLMVTASLFRMQQTRREN